MSGATASREKSEWPAQWANRLGALLDSRRMEGRKEYLRRQRHMGFVTTALDWRKAPNIKGCTCPGRILQVSKGTWPHWHLHFRLLSSPTTRHTFLPFKLPDVRSFFTAVLGHVFVSSPLFSSSLPGMGFGL